MRLLRLRNTPLMVFNRVKGETINPKITLDGKCNI